MPDGIAKFIQPNDRHSLDAMTLCAASLYEFIRELVKCAQHDFGMNANSIIECRDHAIFLLKSGASEGVSFEDDAIARNRALDFLNEFLSFPLQKKM